MQIDVTGQNIDITDPLRDYVCSKFDRIKRHYDNLIDVHVVLKVQKETQHAEATVLASGKHMFADASNGDMYAAIDAMVDKLDRQLLKYKEKLKDHHAEVPHKNISLE